MSIPGTFFRTRLFLREQSNFLQTSISEASEEDITSLLTQQMSN